MITRKHGNGLSHKEVVRFSNRLARFSSQETKRVFVSDFDEGFVRGWNYACKYFSHQLRVKLREVESSTLELPELPELPEL